MTSRKRTQPPPPVYQDSEILHIGKSFTHEELYDTTYQGVIIELNKEHLNEILNEILNEFLSNKKTYIYGNCHVKYKMKHTGIYFSSNMLEYSDNILTCLNINEINPINDYYEANVSLDLSLKDITITIDGIIVYKIIDGKTQIIDFKII
jgi:hypothetical protein